MRDPVVSRRGFIAAGIGLGVSLQLRHLAWAQAPAAGAATAAALPTYRDFRDVYRTKWRWDAVVRGTHTNVNCTSSCAWNLFVRDGLVWREEQSSPYAASNAQVPDFNPRGCQKGASCSDMIQSASRLRYPMMRVGARGEGRWKRISWDEALTQISTQLVDTLQRRGGEGVVLELGPNVDFGANTVAGMRFFRQIGAPVTDSMAQIGDLPVGGTITLGTPHTDGTSDDWFRSDYLVLWAFNPAVARIPDAHFLNEARYRGARVVAISPDYNPSVVHADLWLPVRPGTDAAIALAACQVIIEEKLFDADYVREQSDLPFLLRTDTGNFLRESDVVDGGSKEQFYIWDEAAGAPRLATGCMGSAERTLRQPEGVQVALSVNAKATLADGSTVPVQTVFDRLRAGLAGMRPEDVAVTTGVTAATIRRFAREFAGARSALIISQWGNCKNLHSDLVQRAQILLASLTGNLGRAGGGWRPGAFIALEGMGLVAMQDRLSLPHLALTAARAWWDPAGMRHQFESMYVPSTLFHAVHGGLGEMETHPAYGDPALPEGAGPYLAEALARGHFPMAPAPGSPPPEVIFCMFGNVLRHSRMGDRIASTLFAQAKLIVDVNFRINETGRHADILLPAAAWYEKVGIKYIASFVPYVTLGDRAAAPAAEAKPEWEIFARLAERVGQTARERNVGETRGFRGQSCGLSDLGERFTDYGRYGVDAQEAVTEFILSVSAPSKGVTLADLRRDGGAVRIRSLGQPGGTAGIYSEYSLTEPVVPLRNMVEKKEPYPTLTGRQQFYIDHPWFKKVGEELPTFKAPPAAGGNHPFTLTGAHARWSVHAMWRDQGLMLRLQRGEPLVYINPGDARRRGIEENGYVRVWNDLAEFVARARLSGSIQPGQVHIYHAWEPYQFLTGKTHQHLAPSPFKIPQLVGDYGHLRWGYAHFEPNQVDRDTRVDIARWAPGAGAAA
ncbi:molybdopterin-dependent oxidoreductase [Candidatus Binatia bacterium]|nr:molybdopterin-dependent oxidoreductase [Candidatus Binatia bacterium]